MLIHCVLEIPSSNHRIARLAAHLLSRGQGPLVPLRWTGGDAEGEEMRSPICDDSAGLQVYKEAATLALSSQRRWPTCSLPASYSAAPACCRPRLQVNTLFHGLQSVRFTEELLALAYYASYHYRSADEDNHKPLVNK